MYKIIKTKILASDVTGASGVNTNYRTTMGYNDTSKSISVKVEKLIREELTREEVAPVSYVTVTEREFTVSDFLRQGDHNSWCVDFDVTTETITEPLNLLVFGDAQRIKNPEFKYKDLRSAVTARYSSDLLPLFILKSFDNIDSFDHSLLTFLVVESEETTAYDTVIINSDVEEMNFQQRSDYFDAELTPRIEIQVLDLEDQLVATPTKVVTNNRPDSLQHSDYSVTVPVADAYKIRYTFIRKNFQDTTNVYDVTVINGNVNKNRIVVGSGTEDIILTSTYLTAGDFTKIKLNVGLYMAFSELWITYA